MPHNDDDNVLTCRIKTEHELAKLLWERTFTHQDQLSLPDVLINKGTRLAVFPTQEKLFLEKIQQGFSPLCPGDILEYKLFSLWPLKNGSWVHQSLYVGQGYVVELVRLREFRSPTAHITLRPISDMFVRGDHVDIIPFHSNLSRCEVLRRGLSCLGLYQYSIWTFNCHHAITAFTGEEYDRGISIAVLESFLVILLVVCVFFCVSMAMLFHKKRRNRC